MCTELVIKLKLAENPGIVGKVTRETLEGDCMSAGRKTPLKLTNSGACVDRGSYAIDEFIDRLVVFVLFTEGGPMKMLSNATASCTCLLQKA